MKKKHKFPNVHNLNHCINYYKSWYRCCMEEGTSIETHFNDTINLNSFVEKVFKDYNESLL